MGTYLDGSISLIGDLELPLSLALIQPDRLLFT